MSYTLDSGLSRFDRFVWLLVFLASIGLASYMIRQTPTKPNEALESIQHTSLFLRDLLECVDSGVAEDWVARPVVTSLKTISRPVSGLPHPAVTICGAGHYLDLVRQQLYTKFLVWNTVRNSSQTETEAFAEYLRTVYQVRDYSKILLRKSKLIFQVEPGLSITSLVSTMAAPSPEAAAAAGVTRNQRACATGSSRKRRGLTASCQDGWVLHQDACYRPFNDQELHKLSRFYRVYRVFSS